MSRTARCSIAAWQAEIRERDHVLGAGAEKMFLLSSPFYYVKLASKMESMPTIIVYTANRIGCFVNLALHSEWMVKNHQHQNQHL
eukprot:scaffold13625_cov78-Skeletonema_dohrnii-CCMP3373.AAC.4